ncbi:lipoyl domain-containing protein [Arthrobacter sp. HY1533]|uniref:lipoyl domain-containing protein n=1 Tax=Arthrobacter sp. HY1533 TaxID=2970919 RepID=UPI0022B9E312|nr:lipoyl domain-containing protein [Arthrobacter sp. HY1533]
MEILFPIMSGDPAEPGVLLEWRAPDGSEVAAYQVIAEVTVDKFDAEINSPVSGTLRWLVAEGDEVGQGSVIASVDE